MKRRHGRSPVLRALVGGALAVGACGQAEDPTNVTVTIDATVSHQTLVGFGAATAYLANLLSVRTDDDIFQVLFVDSGLDILRLGNWYQNQSSTDATPDTPFSDSASVQIVQKAAAARGGTPPTILMSAWTPPAYLKSNGVTRPPRGEAGQTYPAGTLIQSGGAYAYGEYADWWVRALQAYAAQGVVPDYVSIQNEPDFFTRYWETCLFGASEGASMEGITVAGYGQAVDAVYHAIQSSDLASPPVLLGPETTGFLGGVVQRYTDGLDLAQLGGIAHHLYGTTEDNPNPDWFNGSMRAVGAAATAAGLPTFMTEYSPNTPTMFDTAWLISNALTVEGVAAYIWWELIWSPMPPTGLVTIESPAPDSTYTINDTYYALKHFARWTDPGWVRVDATSSVGAVRASAFVSPDGGSLTLVLLNTGGKDHVVALSAGGFAYGSQAVYRSWGDSERTAQVAPDSEGNIVLPPRSIATVTYAP